MGTLPHRVADRHRELGAVNSPVEVLLFLILDFLAKIGFGFLLTNREALEQISGGTPPRRRRVV